MRRPQVGGLGELAMHPQTIAIVIQPTPQPRPMPDQRLMRDLHTIPVHGDQPRTRQPLQHLHDRRRLIQLTTPHPPLRVISPLPQRGQPQEQLMRHPPPILIQTRVHRIRGPRERMVDTASRLVRTQTQHRAPTPPPRLPQRMRHQRQRTRLPRRIRHQPRHQRRLHPAPHRLSRTRDRQPQLIGRHRTDQHLPIPQRLDQLRIPTAMPVEIRPHPQHHPHPARRRRRRSRQRRHERRPLHRVRTHGEQLLELVHHQHQIRPVRPVRHSLPDTQMQPPPILGELRRQPSRRHPHQRSQPHRALLKRMRTRREHHSAPGIVVRHQHG